MSNWEALKYIGKEYKDRLSNSTVRAVVVTEDSGGNVTISLSSGETLVNYPKLIHITFEEFKQKYEQL